MAENVIYSIIFDHPDDPLAFRIEAGESDWKRLLWASQVIVANMTADRMSERLVQNLNVGMERRWGRLVARLVSEGQQARILGQPYIAEQLDLMASLFEGLGSEREGT